MEQEGMVDQALVKFKKRLLDFIDPIQLSGNYIEQDFLNYHLENQI